MKLTPSYRPKIAILLLLLYTFIATPVRLWHHHPATQSQVCNNQEKKEGNSLHKAGHGHCSICDHQYAVYHNDASIAAPVRPALFSLLFLTAPAPGVYRLAASSANKGPPAV